MFSCREVKTFNSKIQLRYKDTVPPPGHITLLSYEAQSHETFDTGVQVPTSAVSTTLNISGFENTHGDLLVLWELPVKCVDCVVGH